MRQSVAQQKIPQLLEKCSFFEQIAGLYRAEFMHPQWEKFNLEDPKGALCLFLEGYAFERQGRDPSYPHAASYVIQHAGDPSPSEIWKDFGAGLQGKGLNEGMNPLHHSEKNCKGNKKCVFCFLGFKDGMLLNIITHVKDHLIKNERYARELLTAHIDALRQAAQMGKAQI